MSTAAKEAPIRTPPGLLTMLVLAVALVGCGGSVDPLADDEDQSDGAAPDTEAATPADEEPTPADEAAVADIARDLPGCDLASQAAPEVADVLAETVRTGAVVGPAVLTEDDGGGRTLTVTLVVDDGADYVAVSWAVAEDGGDIRLLPLTEAALAVSPDDADTSRLLGADEEIVLGDTPGSGGMALGYDCSLILAQELYPPPPPPAPQIRDDLIVADPTIVTPGTIVELTFPQATDRGIAFQLDEQVDGEWVTRWWMTSDGNGGEPRTVRTGTSGYGVEDVGVGGPGPDRVLVHPDTEPGDYRICTANAAEDFCTAVEVTSG